MPDDTGGIAGERNPFDTVTPPLSDVDFSLSKQTIPISPHPGTCLFKHRELSSLPVCTKQACSMEGWPFKEVEITEHSVPASLWEAIHLSRSLSQEREQKAKSSLKLALGCVRSFARCCCCCCWCSESHRPCMCL